MACRTLPQEVHTETLRVWREANNSVKAVSAHFGIPYDTAKSRIKSAKARETTQPVTEKFTRPQFPADDIDTGELIDLMCRRFEKRQKHRETRQWYPIHIRQPGPFGVCWFGDPHVDDDGCNWPQLRRDIEAVRLTPMMFGASMGDKQNNWVGRLARLYGQQETSQKTAWKLVEWLIRDSGVDWVLLIKGNHDQWSGSGDPLDWICRGVCEPDDWQAKVRFVAANGREFPVWVAHNFRGHSMWNKNHGLTKMGKHAPIARVYGAGHLHTWKLEQEEDEYQPGRVYWTFRAKGYKDIDSYADNLGFGSQALGHSIVTVFDPLQPNPTKDIKCFADVEEGCDYLRYKRRKYGLETETQASS